MMLLCGVVKDAQEHLWAMLMVGGRKVDGHNVMAARGQDWRESVPVLEDVAREAHVKLGGAGRNVHDLLRAGVA